MKKTLILFILFFGLQLNAQEQKIFTPYFLVQSGYANLNGNYFEIGPQVYLVQKNNNIIDIGLTANLGYMQDQFVFIPEASIGYQFNFSKSALDPYSENFNSSFYVVRGNISPWNITPEVGFNVLGIVEANVGYSFEYRQKSDFKSLEGIKFGILFHLPTQLFGN